MSRKPICAASLAGPMILSAGKRAFSSGPPCDMVGVVVGDQEMRQRPALFVERRKIGPGSGASIEAVAPVAESCTSTP